MSNILHLCMNVCFEQLVSKDTINFFGEWFQETSTFDFDFVEWKSISVLLSFDSSFLMYLSTQLTLKHLLI